MKRIHISDKQKGIYEDAKIISMLPKVQNMADNVDFHDEYSDDDIKYINEVTEKFQEYTNGLVELRARISELENIMDSDEARDDISVFGEIIDKMLET